MRVSRMTGWRAGVAALALLAAGAGSAVFAQEADETDEAAQAAQAVSIVDFAFNPATLTVPAGTRVTWTNTGQAPHTSSATGGQWDSGTLMPRGTFSFTFSTAGSFAYRCNIHPSMSGTITVQAGGAAAPAAGAQPRPQQPGAAPAAPAQARPQQPAAAPAQPRPVVPAAAPAQPRPQQPVAAPAQPRPAAPAPALPRTGTGAPDSANLWWLLIAASGLSVAAAFGLRVARRS